MAKITIEIPLDIAVEIATFGDGGKIHSMMQRIFERELTKLGHGAVVAKARKEKIDELYITISQTLGTEKTKQLEDALKLGKDAIMVASRLNNKN